MLVGRIFFMFFSLVFTECKCGLSSFQNELAMGEVKYVKLAILWHSKLLGEGGKGCDHGINRILDGV